MKTQHQLSTFLLFGLLFVGCSGQKLPADLPKLYPCKITIRDKEGNPMPEVTVTASPEDPASKWGAWGNTNTSGVADMMTAGQYRGVSEGKFRVTLSSFKHTATGTFDDLGAEIYESTSLMSAEYSSSAKTPFQFEMGPKAITLTFQIEK